MKKTSLLGAALILAAVSGMALAAANTPSNASFDVQLMQAKQGIAQIAEAGLERQQGSFDFQLRQAQQKIDEIAKAGLANPTPASPTTK